MPGRTRDSTIATPGYVCNIDAGDEARKDRPVIYWIWLSTIPRQVRGGQDQVSAHVGVAASCSPQSPAAPGPDYRSRTNVSVKVLDFVQLGGPNWKVGSTILELRKGM